MLICERGHKLVLHIIFDAKNRDEQLLAFPAHSLVIDGKEAPISPAFKTVANGWFNSEYTLTAKQVRLDTASHKRRCHSSGRLRCPGLFRIQCHANWRWCRETPRLDERLRREPSLAPHAEEVTLDEVERVLI